MGEKQDFIAVSVFDANELTLRGLCNKSRAMFFTSTCAAPTLTSVHSTGDLAEMQILTQ